MKACALWEKWKPTSFLREEDDSVAHCGHIVQEALHSLKEDPFTFEEIFV
jgi:hypothetical protein